MRVVTVVNAGQKSLPVGLSHCWPVRLLHFAAALAVVKVAVNWPGSAVPDLR